MPPRRTTVTAAAALGAAALLARPAAAATTLTLRLLDTDTYPRALCNDGTPSGYYERPSPSGKSNVWIVWQEGGGFCYDEASCKKRSSDQRSSKKWTPTVDMEGIFDSSDERFADANLVYVGYCSSDSYVGAATADDVPFGFNFLGSEIVTAVFTDLREARGLGSAEGTQVLYTGCSAGARGAMFNADRVYDLLHVSVGGNLARFAVLLDSAFYVDVQPFDPALPSLMELMANATAMIGANATAIPACAAVVPPEEIWKCFYGQYALPFVKSPYLLNAFLYDSYQLGKNGIASKPKTPEGLSWAEGFRNATSFWAREEVPRDSADYAAMLPACFKHCNTKTATWGTLTVDGVTLEAATASWFFGDATAPAYLEDTCEGWACGPGCA